MANDNEDIVNKLEEAFNKFPDAAEVEFFNNERFAGFDIAWTLKGIGFGHITYSYDKVDKVQRADTECMSEESVVKILKLAAPAIAKKLVEIDKQNIPYSGYGDDNTCTGCNSSECICDELIKGDDG